MAIFETNDGLIEAADPLIRALTRNAEFAAELTAESLNQVIFKESQHAYRLPANFLLELGATLQIGYWELHEISAHIEAGLPSYAHASLQLAERAGKKPTEFTGRDAAPLHKQVLQFWVNNFAWDGLPLLKTDIILGAVDEDQFLELSAVFLWQHRHELQNLLTIGEADNG